MPSAAPPPATIDVRVQWRPDGVRYVSGLTIYDEALIDGRWLGRYWSASGYVKPEKDIADEFRRRRRILPSAFLIEVDGQNLGGHWRWLASSDTATANGGEAVVDLQNDVRPIKVSVHTRLDGTACLERWLEITNQGATPAALGETRPFAGLIWAVGIGTDRPEAAMRRESPFSRGYIAAANWGEEGDFRWEPITGSRTSLVGRRGRSGFGRPSTFLRNELSGESAILDLAWSGNWSLHLDRIEVSSSTCPRRSACSLRPSGRTVNRRSA